MGERQRTLWVDVTTLLGWAGQPTGIARTLTQLLRYWQGDERMQVRLCQYDRVYRCYQTVDPAELQGPRPAAVKKRARDTADDSFIKRWIPSEVRETIWHLGMSGLWFARLCKYAVVRSCRLARQLTARVRPPARTVRFSPGDVLFLGGTTWMDGPPTEKLQAIKADTGIKVAYLTYDIIPVCCPHLCAPYLKKAWEKWLPGMLGCADLVLTISEHSRKDLVAFCRQHTVPLPPIETFRLGDEPGEGDAEEAPAELLARQPGPFVLYVSTLGLHKNHQLLFNVWRSLADRLGDSLPTLVLAGGMGWRHKELTDEREVDPVLSRRVIHLSKATDSQLRWLYRHCQFTLYPSWYEGWGLPVAESLVYGKPCICSSATSLPEVGGALVDYHDPMDVPACRTLVEKALLEPGWLASREERIRREFRATTWRDSAAQTWDLLDRHFGSQAPAALRDAA